MSLDFDIPEKLLLILLSGTFCSCLLMMKDIVVFRRTATYTLYHAGINAPASIVLFPSEKNEESQTTQQVLLRQIRTVAAFHHDTSGP